MQGVKSVASSKLRVVATVSILSAIVAGLVVLHQPPFPAPDPLPPSADGAVEPTRERFGPRVDVAGHLAIAAQAARRPRPESPLWGAVPVGIAVATDGSVVWAQYRTNSIERVAADGSDRTTLAAVDGPLGIALDQRDGTILYTADRHYPRLVGLVTAPGATAPLIYGENVNRPFAITLAPDGRMVFWSESINGRIRSMARDGSDVVTLVDDGIASGGEEADAVAMSPFGIAVDEQRDLLFWSDVRTATITRSRLDGSERTTILGREDGLEFPTGLAVDTTRGKLYWADPGSERIQRAAFDGTARETVASTADGVLEPYGVAVDEARRMLYWTDIARNALFQTSLDDRRTELFVTLDAQRGDVAAVASSACASAVQREQVEFLRHWLKSVRTCVVGVAATQAVIRRITDLRLPAASCARQLARANDASGFRSVLEKDCAAAEVHDAIEDALDLGATIVAADLPHARAYLRKVRPFIAAEASKAQATTAALAALDTLVQRLESLRQNLTVAHRDADWSLPATGQTTTYAATTKLAGGATAVADDGATRAGWSPAFVDNGDGTITDRHTGLMWEKKCHGCGGLHDVDTRIPWEAGGGAVDVAGWLEAMNVEAGSGFAGYGDWRLPDAGELLGLIDFENFNPAVGPAFDGPGCGLPCASVRDPECSCTRLGSYWAGGESPNPEGTLTTVAFHLGVVWGHTEDNDAYVRAVRGARPMLDDRFVDNGDGTITDRVTRLMWEKKCRCPESLHDVSRRMYWSFDGTKETIWDWVDAANREGGSGFAGYDDWRMPNVQELYSLFDGRQRDPSIDPAFARDACADVSSQFCSLTARGMHWTSTTFADFPSLAVAVGFSTPGPLEREAPEWVIRVAGGVEPHEKTLRMAARLVRGPVPNSGIGFVGSALDRNDHTGLRQ